MRVLKNIACFLGVSAITFFISPADAIQYKGASVYKATENGVTTVYLDGTTGSRVAGACG